MSPAERRRVVDSLPSEFELTDAQPIFEGDLHFDIKVTARNTLQAYFARLGRRVYLACELPVLSPGEKLFAPDVMAVLDVEVRAREKWVVKDEGKGPDFALDIIVTDRRRRNLRSNIERYARLGIAEYFVFDRARLQLHGYRLPAAGARVYEPIVPESRRLVSHVLGLDLRLAGARLRFLHGTAALPDAQELIASLERMVGDVEEQLQTAEAQLQAAEARAEEETRLRAEEARLRTEEARLRAEAEARLAEALAENERLKAERDNK